MAAEFSRAVANELDVIDFESDEPKVSVNGVTSVMIRSKNPANKNFRVHVVKDNSEECQSLEYSATLAAFYNSQFVNRILTLNKLIGPFGKYELSLKLVGEEDMHTVFAVQVDDGKKKKVLSLEDLCTVAQAIAKYHYVNEKAVSPEVYRAITENYENIADFEKEHQRKIIGILDEVLHSVDRKYFSNPEEILSKVNYLVERCSKEYTCCLKGTGSLVLCNGKLNASSCLFNKHELTDISNWENAHFADHAKDLAYLIISSAEPSVRRNHYLTVFRHYYFALVDVRPPNFEIEALRNSYLSHQKHIVLSELDSILYELSTETDEAIVRTEIERWQAALDDAYAFECNDYESDNEDCLFSR